MNPMQEWNQYNPLLKSILRKDASVLLSPDILENSPAIKELKTSFRALIPDRFSEPHLFISPIQSSEHVLRSNCTNENCGIRVTTHIKRDDASGWSFADFNEDKTVKVVYDRQQNNPCTECSTLLNKETKE